MKKGKKTNKSKEIEDGSRTKFDRRRERWSVAVWCSLFVLAASLVCGMFVEMPEPV